MSATKRRVEGFDYLYQRGRSYEVRVQVPRGHRPIVGKGELKKSLGSDFVSVRRRYHREVANLKAVIENAQDCTNTATKSGDCAHLPSRDDIEAACYFHFRRMAQNMRGKVAEPVGDNPRELANRAKGFRVIINNHLSANAEDAWEVMAADADWLCEEKGWTVPRDNPLFEHLCRTMLRGRLQC